MPREMIRNCDGGPWFVKVGWEHGRDVQVGVENDDDRSLFWLLVGEEKRELLGAEVRKIVAEANESGTRPLGDCAIGEQVLNALDVTASAYRGVWATMGRQDCNDLIRVLRRARDSAFGRDE